ncbi:MAG: prepilin-type N-terminal cleavage/methylation domain-containing protein [Patescibacteria group bacterium]|mgnify:CR=1 FL=1
MRLYSQQRENFKKYFCFNLGFTMIEMVVSVGIISLLSAIFLANYHGANHKTELNMEAQKVVSNLNLARSFSLSSKKYNNSLPAGGWGVHFKTSSPDKYLIFADVNNNQSYDDGEADIDKGGRVINLPDNIIIDSADNGGTVDVVFLPPDPAIYFNGSIEPVSSAWVKLKEKDNNIFKTITINSLGLSEISD